MIVGEGEEMVYPSSDPCFLNLKARFLVQELECCIHAVRY